MDKRLEAMYRKLRKASPVMLVGENARLCLSIARTIGQWNVLEFAGLVRITAEDDPDPDFSYLDTWPHVSAQTRTRLLEEWAGNTVIVSCEYRLDESSPWCHGDSIGSCTGYRDATSPFENCYVSDLMDATINALKVALRDRYCRRCGCKVA